MYIRIVASLVLVVALALAAGVIGAEPAPITVGEDAAPVRSGTAPEVLAAHGTR